MARSHRPTSSLAPLVLAGALLLSGCGGESSGEVVGTADPQASASASTGGAGSPSASSTGYEKATPEHPARNVPVPTLPEAAKEETFDGAKAFMQYWQDSMQYLVQTGDKQYAADAVSAENPGYVDLFDQFAEYYNTGQWITDGLPNYRLESDGEWGRVEGYYILYVYQSRPDGRLWDKSGNSKRIPGNSYNGQPQNIYLDYVDGKWKFVRISDIQGIDYGDN